MKPRLQGCTSPWPSTFDKWPWTSAQQTCRQANRRLYQLWGWCARLLSSAHAPLCVQEELPAARLCYSHASHNHLKRNDAGACALVPANVILAVMSKAYLQKCPRRITLDSF